MGGTSLSRKPVDERFAHNVPPRRAGDEVLAAPKSPGIETVCARRGCGPLHVLNETFRIQHELFQSA
jgi:hypothetical protein